MIAANLIRCPTARPIRRTRACAEGAASARRFDFEEMLGNCVRPAQVLHVRSVELAMVVKVGTFVRSLSKTPMRRDTGRPSEPPER